ncbi:glycerophosphodiester phosphodiesterase [Mucilaginibacter sp. PAMC 26640]|nr:glycerophosphodiester phosphodiesterase [Mucilaginibacter sp. PAMC 26640]
MKNKILLFATLFMTNHVFGQIPFDKEGHRGGRGLMPENSILSMKKAVDLGVTLEMDISFSKDKEVLVAHDQYILSVLALKPNGDTISKTEQEQLKLYQMPYEEIKSYVYGKKYYPLFPDQQKLATYIPKLSEVIDSSEAYAKKLHENPPVYNIETKTSPDGDGVLHPGPEEFVERLMAVILKKHIEKRVIIQSFDPRTLEIVHRKYPAIPISYLVYKNTLEANLQLLSFTPDIYSPVFKLVDAQLLESCHAKKMRVIPWTVNEQADIDRLKKLGVDGLISDYPDRL